MSFGLSSWNRREVPLLRPRIRGKDRSSEACLETLTSMAFLEMQERRRGLLNVHTWSSEEGVRLQL